jgi:4-amino-4-deoxy-L-arabinose transferase-like glycosyltransferase
MFGTPVGIIMAAIITFSPYHVQYSQDARMYTMLLFITAISIIFYLEAVKSDNLKYWILFGLVSALAIWTHFMALIVIGALIIYSIFYMIKEKMSPKNFLLSIVVMTVLLSPLILLIKELFMDRIGSAPTYGLTGDRFIVDSLVYFFGYTPLSFCVFGILFCLGAVWLFSEFREKFYFLFFILSISIVTGYILCDLMPIAPRYFIFLLPFSYAIIASSALPFLQKLSEKSVIAIFVVLFICLWSPQLYAYYNTPINEDWRAAAVFVKDTAKANDIVIIMPDYNQIPFNFYYNNSTYGTIQFNTASKDDLEKINSLRCKNNVSAFILVTNDLGVVDLSGEATTWIRNPEIITEMGNFNGVRVRKITANC